MFPRSIKCFVFNAPHESLVPTSKSCYITGTEVSSSEFHLHKLAHFHIRLVYGTHFMLYFQRRYINVEHHFNLDKYVAGRDIIGISSKWKLESLMLSSYLAYKELKLHYLLFAVMMPLLMLSSVKNKERDSHFTSIKYRRSRRIIRNIKWVSECLSFLIINLKTNCNRLN